jgi:hypothetical protein
LRAAAGVSVWGSQLARRDRFVDRLRADLGADVFDDAHTAGAEFSYGDALDQAARVLQS